MKKFFTILCLMALTLGAQAQTHVTQTGQDYLNETQLKAGIEAATDGYYVALQIHAGSTFYVGGDGKAVSTFSTTGSTTWIIEKSGEKYVLKNWSGQYIKTLGGNGTAATFTTNSSEALKFNIAQSTSTDANMESGYVANKAIWYNVDGTNTRINTNSINGTQKTIWANNGTGCWTCLFTYSVSIKYNIVYKYYYNDELVGSQTSTDLYDDGEEVTITDEMVPALTGYNILSHDESVTINGANAEVTVNCEPAATTYTLNATNAPTGTTFTVKGQDVANGGTVSITGSVAASDVVATFPTGYEHYSYTATISGTTITVNCKAMTAVTDLADLTDGYYVVYGRANNAGGYFYHDKALGDRPYRLGTSTSVDLDAAQYNNETNFKYVWILKKNNDSDNSFTLRNCGTFNYFIADQNRNQNCQGSATANLVLDIANQWMYQTNYKNGDNILYLHVNQPGGDMNFSYWDGNGTPGGSGSLVAPVFYKVQLSDEAVAQIVANRKEDLSAVLTTLSSLPTGEGLNKYTVTEAGTNAITEASAVNNNENATLEEVDEAIELLENLGDAFSLNMPQANTFLRIKSVVGDKAYLKAADAGATMTFSTTADASTIFCYIDGKLVAYQNGLAVNEINKMGTAGGAATTFTFKEGLNGAISTYSLYGSDSQVLYSTGTNGSNADWFNPNSLRDNTTFTLEPVTELPITLRSTDGTNYFATFSAPVPVEISDAKLCSVSSNSNKWIQYTATENTQHAADHGVLLHATGSGEKTIQATATILTETEATDTYGLTGYSAAFAVSDNTKLFLGKGSKSGKVGFYALGSVSTNGFKAYFDNSTGEAKEGFDLVNANETTGVESIDNSQFAIDNAPVYNLQGQRVNKAQKGVFIQNGKKMVVK